jgi:hypothetical protein
MAGKLLLVNSHDFSTSNAATVTFTGITSTNTHRLIFNNLRSDTTDWKPRIRFTKSGTPETTTNYNQAGQYDFYHTGGAGNNSLAAFIDLGIASGPGAVGQPERNWGLTVMDINNLADSSNYDWYTMKNSFTNWQGNGYVNIYGGSLRLASASDGIHFFNDKSATLIDGNIALYEVIDE